MTPDEWAAKALYGSRGVGPTVFVSPATASALHAAVAAAVREAVNEKVEACAKRAEGTVATFEMTQSPLGIQGHIAAAIRALKEPPC